MKVNLNKRDLIEEFKTDHILHSMDDSIFSYYRKYMEISEDNEQRRLFCFIESQKTLDLWNLHFINIFNAFYKLTEYIIYKNPKLLEHLRLTDLDIEGIKKRDKATLLGYSRLDAVLSEDSFSLLEINTKRPQMYEDADWLSVLLQNILNKNISFEPETNSKDIAESIYYNYYFNNKHIPENIIYVPDINKLEYDFSLYINLYNIFNTSNIIVTSEKDLYQKIENKKTNLIYNNNLKIDLIIDQSKNYYSSNYSLFTPKGAIRNKMIAEAYRNKKLEIYTPPSSLIAGTKIAYTLIQDAYIQNKINLSEEEIKSISLLPLSIHSKNWLLYKDKIDKDRYVIKSSGKGQGKGVTLGVDMDHKTWHKHIDDLLAKEISFILQHKVDFQEKEIFLLDSMESRIALVTLEPFIINNPNRRISHYISGYSTRAILKDDYYQGAKFNPAYDRKDILFGGVVGTNE